MAKDPAFLFYSQDFYTGTAVMSFEDKGKFIHILCLMHQQGRMKEETIRFCVGSVSDNLKSKFRIDKNGFWFNERLEIESEKRANFTKSRVDNGSKGGRPKKIKPIGLAKNNHMGNHMGDENDNENKDVIDNTNKEEKIEKIVFPFSSDEFMEMWGQWKTYKKVELKFLYKSQQSEQAALSDLAKLSGGFEDIAMAIIRQSMANGWKGFFELKTNENGTYKRTTVGNSKSAGARELLASLKEDFRRGG